jgi:hypothetical protein
MKQNKSKMSQSMATLVELNISRECKRGYHRRTGDTREVASKKEVTFSRGATYGHY